MEQDTNDKRVEGLGNTMKQETNDKKTENLDNTIEQKSNDSKTENPENATEQETNDINIENLENALSFFMVPFYYEGTFDKQMKSLWKEENQKIIKSDYLFPYITQFLQGQMDDLIDKQERLSVYCLNDDNDFVKSAWINKFSKCNYVKVDKDTPEIEFSLLPSGKNSLKKPHLFISDAANIGILSFCAEIAKEQRTMSNLKLFNYAMHKIDSQVPKCMNKTLIISGSDTKEAADSTRKLRELTRSVVALHNEKKKKKDIQNEEETEFSWNIKTFIDGLLGDVGLFIPPRIHVFSFIQVDDTKDNNLGLEDFSLDLIKLSKCEKDSYDEIDDEDIMNDILQTYKNIFISSSVAGTAMIAIAQSQNKGFIRNMDNDALPRYLLIYMLALIQRFTLQYLDIRITDVLKKKRSNQLSTLIDTICSVKVRCLYSEVSPFPQHNLFYQYCCKSFNIAGHYQEISDKVDLMKTVIMGKREQYLTIFLAILTVLQGTASLKDIFLNCFNLTSCISMAICILAFIGLIYLYKTK